MAANIETPNYCTDYILILFVIAFMLSILFTALSKADRICTQSMATSKTVT